MHAFSCRAAVAALTLCPIVAQGAAPPATPEGLFFHTFTGAASGSEWSTWGPRSGTGRYEFADLTAGGAYTGNYFADGSFVFDFGRGTGSFSDTDHASIEFTLGGGTNFHSQISRAPYTDERFPVFFTSAVAGDTALSGSWSARVLDVDPATGQTLDERTIDVDVLVSGTTVRITTPDATYYQGSWIGADQAAFRVISPTPTPTRYRTFPGSETSVNQNMLGDLRLLEDGSMTFAVFFQTRDPFGSQVQTMRYMTLTEVPAPGAIVPLILGCALTPRRR